MSTPAQTVIVIPDISGFSKFVTEIALSHSEHIITELLEIIIDCNTLGLSVSEIEGDAVLFYKTGKIPPTAQVIEMTKNMFIRFHEHLMQYEQNRICQCGACRTAYELSLKVVVDQGNVKEVKVKKHVKLFGPALISAHRLLKNNVPSSAYLLLSENYIELQKGFQTDAFPDWVAWQKDSYEYPSLGEVSFHYTLLSPLHQKLRSLEEQHRKWHVKHPVIIQQEVEVNYQYAYQVISNDLMKIHWMSGLKEVVPAEPDEIYSIGSQHLCVLNTGMSLEFSAKEIQVSDEELSYMELLKRMGIFTEIAFFYRIIKLTEQRSLIKLEIHYAPPKIIRPLAFMALRFMAWGFKKSLRNLKTYLEENAPAAGEVEPVLA